MPGFKILIETGKSKENLKSLKDGMRDLGTTSVNTERQMKGFVSNTMKSLGSGMASFRTSIAGIGSSLFSLKGLLVSLGIGAVAKSFLNASTAAEGYNTRLRVLLGSQEKANQLFKDMTEFAGKVPFTFEQIMEGATSLAGIMKGNVAEINKWMPMIADLAAASGLSMQETISNFIKMYSAGAQAADMFRERGILAMMGFKAGATYTVKETREKMMEEWNKTGSQFKGATDQLAQTWDGTMSMIEDKWFQFRIAIMDAGVFEFLTQGLKDVDTAFGEWTENSQKSIKELVKTYMPSIIDSVGLLTKSVVGMGMAWKTSFAVLYETAAWLAKAGSVIANVQYTMVMTNSKLTFGSVSEDYKKQAESWKLMAGGLNAVYEEFDKRAHDNANSVKGMVDTMNTIDSKTEEYKQKWKDIVTKMEEAEKVQEDLVDSSGTTSSNTSDTAESWEDIKKAQDKIRQQQQWEFEQFMKTTEMQNALSDAMTMKEPSQEKWKTLFADPSYVNDSSKAIQDYLATLRDQYFSLYDSLDETSGTYFDVQRELLQKNYDDEMTKMEVLADNDERFANATYLVNLKYSKLRRDLWKKEVLLHGNARDVMLSAWDDYERESLNINQTMYDAWINTFQGIQQGFSDILYDGMMMKFDSIEDAWKSMWTNMKSIFIRAIADMMAQEIMINVGLNFGKSAMAGAVGGATGGAAAGAGLSGLGYGTAWAITDSATAAQAATLGANTAMTYVPYVAAATIAYGVYDTIKKSRRKGRNYGAGLGDLQLDSSGALQLFYERVSPYNVGGGVVDYSQYGNGVASQQPRAFLPEDASYYSPAYAAKDKGYWSRTVDLPGTMQALDEFATYTSNYLPKWVDSSKYVSRLVENLIDSNQDVLITASSTHGAEATIEKIGTTFDTVLSQSIKDNFDTYSEEIVAYYNSLAEMSGEVVSTAIRAGLESPDVNTGIQTFMTSVHQQMYDSILDSIITAMISSEVYQQALGPFFDSLNQGITESMIDGVFHPEIFTKYIATPLQEALTAVEGLEPFFEQIYGLAGSFKDTLGLNQHTSSIQFPEATSGKYRTWRGYEIPEEVYRASISNPDYSMPEYLIAYTGIKGYASGLPTVPYDRFPAILHKDEAVLTKEQANTWRSGGTTNIQFVFPNAVSVDKGAVRELANIILPQIHKLERLGH